MKTYNSRVEMLRGEVPKGSVCCEVGVFMLDFSRQILEVVDPALILLVDCFPSNMFSCDEHGGNPRHVMGHLAMRAAAELAEGDKRVLCRFGLSRDVLGHEAIRAMAFDFVYIDADHSYEAIKHDLELAWPLIRPGGALAGHDYTLCEDRVIDRSHYAGFGVKQAVDEFCAANSVEIAAIAMDGYTSFLIRKPR
jgi:hypothetical protein